LCLAVFRLSAMANETSIDPSLKQKIHANAWIFCFIDTTTAD
jgi:hypothetical protein